MDEHTLRVLDFDKIRGLLAERAASPLGSERALSLTPSTSLDEVRRWLSETSEMSELLRTRGFTLQGVRDIRPALRKAEVAGGALAPREFLDIAATLAAVGEIKAALNRAEDLLRALAPLRERLIPIASLESEIGRVFDPSGEIADRASPHLKGIRSQLGSARARVQEKLEAILSSPDAQTWLQDRVVTIREGRYVLPVREHGKDRIRGIVHDRSASGQTFFVEPLATVELNNRIRELLLEEQEEIERILRALTDSVRNQLPHLEVDVCVLAELDLIYARAGLSLALNGAAPTVSADGFIKLRRGYHPLLLISRASGKADGKAVPLDLELGNSFTSLVITGPNTGGKTVALKTVGLLVLMVQAGLHIPASPDSTIPIFVQIFADIGDEQSIEQSLSTFSSHLQHIVKILRHADARSLVLLDELGAGTDPQEGSALAMAILERLTEAQVRTIATTHIGSLKLFAHYRSGMENASMQFDRSTLSPTFQLLMGIPGSSNAFEIAERLGAPRQIVDRARQFMDSRELRVTELIQDLEEGIRRSREETDRAARRSEEATRSRQEYDQLLLQLREDEKTLRRKTSEEARRKLAEARALAEDLIRELRDSRAAQQVVQKTRQTLAREIERVDADLLTLASTARPRRPVADPCIGQHVWVEGIESPGRLLSLPDQQGMVRVEAGSFHLRVPLETLSIRDGSPTPSSCPAEISCPEARTVPLELHLRGLTGDEAVERLQKYIDDAVLGGAVRLRVVHGKGTGALKKRIEAALRVDPRVKAFYPAERHLGGTGVTVVELRE